MADLPQEIRGVLLEEQALLERVQKALAERRAARAGDARDLLERLRELREQAAKAAAHDLPTLFQEMNLVRALLEHPETAPSPDPRSPYFAHLRLREGGTCRDYLLGRASFIDTRQDVRVLDWRYAPMARIFYRYREGDFFEEQFPGRLAEGVVEARRVVVVHDGVLNRVLTPAFTLTRDASGQWNCSETGRAALGGGAGTAARAGSLGVGGFATDRTRQADISALLDREQFEALSASPEQPLLVLGSAGSGKTTVALHRLATLTFQDPERFPPRRMQVVVPEPGLARLSARLLEPHGLGAVAVRTLDVWAREQFRAAFGIPVPPLCLEAPPLVTRLKRHPALYHLLRQRLMRGGGHATYAYIRRELGELFTDRGLLAAVVQRAQGDLPQTAVEETVRHTRMQLLSRTESAETYAGAAFDALDGRSVDDDTPDELAGTLDLEDLPLMLFVKAWRSGELSGSRLAHLVVDEAEDISLFELFVLGRLVGPRPSSVTLAGDDAQQTFSSFAGWEQALAALGVQDAAVCRLQTTYRCPRPVAQLAQAVLGPLAPPVPLQAGREGVPVGRFELPSEAHAHLFLADAVRDLVDREPQASVGIIARGPEAAQALYRLLADLPEARLVLNGEFSFQPGVDVTDVENVKGLEFDYVIVPDASAQSYPNDDESRRMLHVALTRASHQLWVVSVGSPSPLLPPAAEGDAPGSGPGAG